MRQDLLRGSVAGAIAGALTALYHLLVTEPVLERAIAYEAAGAGPVSREVQKYAGGPAGQILFGVAVGLLFALTYRHVPAFATAWRRSLALAASAWLILALIPQLRYPANPPGVGDPDTISSRTSGYLASYLLGLAVVSGCWWALGALRRRDWAEPQRWVFVVVGGVMVIAVGYAFLPEAASAHALPADLVWDFRVRALGGLTLLFAALGAVFGLMSERGERPSVAPLDRSASLR